jgi:hypothetical protein
VKIKLKDSIISELTCLGLRPGMVVSGTISSKTTGSVDFTHYHNGSHYDCVVWPEDYEVIDENKANGIPVTEDLFKAVPKDIASDITLQIAEVTNALDAMHWCFCPFLDNSDLAELPWIVNLIKSYNSIVTLLPSPWNLQYEPVEY